MMSCEISRVDSHVHRQKEMEFDDVKSPKYL